MEPLQALLHWLYRSTYEDSFADDSKTSFAVKLYAVADKYDVPKLQQLAAERLKSLCEELKKPSDLVDVLRLLVDGKYVREDDFTLGETVLPAIVNNFGAVFKLDEFKKFVLEYPVWALPLLDMLAMGRPSITTSGGDAVLKFHVKSVTGMMSVRHALPSRS